MRIAFCLLQYFPFSGLARDMLRIAECARKRGHDVSIFTSRWQGEPATGMHTEILPVESITNHGRVAAFNRSLQRRLGGDFDCVLGFSKLPGLDVYYAADACFAARARYHRHPLYRLTPRYKGYRRLENAVFCATSRTHILALSEHAVSEYQEFYGTRDSRFTLLPPTLQDQYRRPPVDLHSRARRARGEAGIADEDTMILMVGSGFRTKGVDRAVLAVAALPAPLRHRARLVIAGRGKPGPFRSLASACGIGSRVHFLGGRDDVPELMSAADLLLHPAYNENTGAVLLEAMAMGLPVLTTAACGYAHYVAEAGAGVVLDTPFNQQSLDRALLHMISADGGAWRRSGPGFTKNPMFFSMPDQAVDVVESLRSDGSRAEAKSSGLVYLADRLSMASCEATLDHIMAMPGEVYRKASGRRTVRVVRNGTGYFLKTHSGVGWGEIVKNLVSLKLPVLGAQNEWHALHLLRRKGLRVPRPLGFGTRGRNPARRESFVLTEEIVDAISLEELSARCAGAADFALRRALIGALAGIARTLHQSGVNHRDLYLCHFLIARRGAANNATCTSLPPDIVLIDLHRAQIRRRTPMRWIVKDLGALYYSAMDGDLRRNDLYRFMKAYCGCPLRSAIGSTVDWNRVRRRALRLYRTTAAGEPRGFCS